MPPPTGLSRLAGCPAPKRLPRVLSAVEVVALIGVDHATARQRAVARLLEDRELGRNSGSMPTSGC